VIAGARADRDALEPPKVDAQAEKSASILWAQDFDEPIGAVQNSGGFLGLLERRTDQVFIQQIR
jgi:hypothetical protein